ncbi:MAG: rod shape-determining protein RodA [Halobacteriovoraceae bacterium]|nr:rod shape-determining protein RodA [Halobacteriovoraceae bacterium]|tara:strand:- start:7722 stop:8831 length:1110 start_codon:yes stop_codon:yes gene_type:complete
MKQTLLNFFKKYDFSFIFCMYAIFFIGILNLYSATHAHSSEMMQNLYLSQLKAFGVANIIVLIVSLFPPKSLLRFSYWFYAINVFLLILVLIMGQKGMGAQRWLVLGGFRIQPSELMKICLALALSRYFSRHNPEKELYLKNLIIPFLITLLPTVLIIMQPDLGTGLLLVLIFLVISFYKRLRWKSIFMLGVLGVVSSVLMYNFALKPYQKQRVLTFLNPQADAKGSGYNAIQSQIAIGSGRWQGKGFKESTQASLNYLPENHTDFVFSIFNEEHGFIGSFFLISLYFVLLMRFIWLSGAVLHFYDSILAIGLMSIFFWHTFINMAMVMGLAPIVGLPLPLMSYGGSSLVTFGICIGLATSLSNSRNLF